MVLFLQKKQPKLHYHRWYMAFLLIYFNYTLISKILERGAQS